MSSPATANDEPKQVNTCQDDLLNRTCEVLEVSQEHLTSRQVQQIYTTSHTLKLQASLSRLVKVIMIFELKVLQMHIAKL